MISENLSTKTLNYSYLTGKNVSVFNSDILISNKALIFYVDSKNIRLSIAYNSIFIKNKELNIEILYEGSLLKMNCYIHHYEDGILFLKMPRTTQKIQQRGTLRVGCEIDCSIEFFVKGKIKNISAGGAFITISSPVGKQLLLDEQMKICFNIQNKDLRLDCNVIEMTNKFVRVKFLNINEVQKELLVQFCCKIDRDIYRGNFDG